MSEWKEYLIEEIADILNHRRIPLSSMERNKKRGIYPYFGASGIIDYIDDYIFEGEHVLVSEDGENLKTRKTPIAFIANSKFWVNNHAHILKGKKDYINKLIVYYLENLDLNEFLTGAVQPKLNKASLTSIPFVLPKDENLRIRIVSILSSLDDKIDLLLRQNTTLEKMAETLFRQWFVEEVKEVSEHYKIADLAIHYKESILPQKDRENYFVHYSIPSFDKGKQPVVERGFEIQSNKYKVPKNSILFSKLNPHKDKRIWLLQEEVSDNSICSTEFQIVLPKKKEHLYFLFLWLSTNENYNEIASGIGGTSGSHQRIDPETIFRFSCPTISDRIIESLNWKVESLFAKIKNNQKQILALIDLRNQILPKLMSGEISIKP